MIQKHLVMTLKKISIIQEQRKTQKTIEVKEMVTGRKPDQDQKKNLLNFKKMTMKKKYFIQMIQWILLQINFLKRKKIL